MKFRLYLGMALLLLAGCATSEPNVSEKNAVGTELLTSIDEILPNHLIPLNGGARGASLSMRFPSALSARNNDVYFVDAAQQQIFRYDYMQRTLAPFVGVSVSEKSNLYVGADMSLYVTDPNNKQVLHYSRAGQQLPSFSSPGNIARPIAVVENLEASRVLVADALYDQIVVLNQLGMTLSIVKSDNVVAIGAIAAGPDGVYVLDRMAKKVVVLDWDGQTLYSLADGDLIAPSAIAVSRDNYVFVADNFDHTVKVYRDNAQVTKVTGFFDIAGLAVDNNLLYVADSQNARVRVFRINAKP